MNQDVYHYAGNNPVKMVDPDGKQSFPTLDMLFGHYNITTVTEQRINERINYYCSIPSKAGEFLGIRFIVNAGLGATGKAGPVDVDFSLRANLDDKGNLWVSLGIGPKTKDGSFGIFVSGQILKNGEFAPDNSLKYSIGANVKHKDFKTIIRSMENYKEWEMGASVSGIVGLEVRWKPYTLLKNVLNKIKGE